MTTVIEAPPTTEPATEPVLPSWVDADVQQKARLLDRIDPTWHERVNTDALYLASTEMCVLGQAFTTFFLAYKRLEEKAESLGVEFLGGRLSDNRYKKDWIAVIEQRRQ